MNYRHAYHAGNFADVLKHAVLARVIAHLALKRAPFRVIDTHAGAGLYDLQGDEALRTGEWRTGIGRLLESPVPAALLPLLGPYLAAVRTFNPRGRALVYPGSPHIALAGMRGDDALIACELHPLDAETLAASLVMERRAKVLALDGWMALRGLLPPKERRGVVLIDPPYEKEGETERLLRALVEGVRRFATGTYIAWYPIKHAAERDDLHQAAIGAGLQRVLAVELAVAAFGTAGLTACGLLVVNPPWTLAEELEAGLPELAALLATGPGARADWHWLVPETPQGEP